MSYFNFSTHRPADWWGRRSFTHAWWNLYSDDPRWTPPDFVAWQRLVMRMDAPYWQRADAQLLYLEALPSRRQPINAAVVQPAMAGAVFEEPVAAAVLLCEPSQGTVYLSMLHCVNDEETLDRLLAAALEHGIEAGCARLVGPTGVIPGWNSGVLTNFFHTLPPSHTPYNPPYLADLLDASMTICQGSVLLHLPVMPDAESPAGPATLQPLDLSTVDNALLTLFEAALAPHAPTPALSADAADLLIRWISVYPTIGWLARVNETPVGFVVVQPDLAPLMRRLNGGRPFPLRWLAALAKRRPASRGRLLFGAVSPAWRRQGIGRQLLNQALHYAASAGWNELVCGPFVDSSPVVTCLQQKGARLEQRYELYEWNG